MATHVAPNVSGGETVKILTSAGDVDPNIYTVDKAERTIIWLLNKESPGTAPIKVHRQRIKEIVTMGPSSPTSTAGTAKPKLTKPEADESLEDESDDESTAEAEDESDDSSEDEAEETSEDESEEENAEVEASESGAEAEEDESEAEADASSAEVEDKETETVTNATVTAPAPAKQAKTPKSTEPKAPKTPKAAKPKKTGVPFDFAPTLASGAEVWSKDVNFDHKDKGITARAHTVIAADGKSYRTFNTYNGSLGKDGGGHSEFPIPTDVALEKKRETLKKKGYVQMEA